MTHGAHTLAANVWPWVRATTLLKEPLGSPLVGPDSWSLNPGAYAVGFGALDVAR
jgi:hypothetical protein